MSRETSRTIHGWVRPYRLPTESSRTCRLLRACPPGSVSQRWPGGAGERCRGNGAAGLGAVQAALADVLDDAVGDEVPDRVAGLDAVAALGGGDGQGGDLDEADALARQPGGGQAVAGAGAADEVGELEQLVG